MSVKSKVSIAATALALLGVYGVAQVVKDRADESLALVTATWGPFDSPGVVIVVRVGGKVRVAGKNFFKSPFGETYPVKRGDAILIVIDPILPGVQNIECSIVVDGVQRTRQPPSNGHTVCGPVIT